MGEGRDSGEDAILAIEGNRGHIGGWSADLGDIITTDVELSGMIREGRTAEARSLLLSRSAEEQAALVAIDADPEAILSLTAMDDGGRPGYRAEVVNRLPSAVLTQLLVPRDSKLVRFNTQVLAKMTPAVFERTVVDTLDPVYYHGNRSKISWEWLTALAALDDINKIAELLGRAGHSLLEDALLERMETFDMNAVIFPGVSAFRTVSESGGGLMLPPIWDPEVAEILNALHAAAPELLAGAIRSAWERAGAL